MQIPSLSDLSISVIKKSNYIGQLGEGYPEIVKQIWKPYLNYFTYNTRICGEHIRNQIEKFNVMQLLIELVFNSQSGSKKNIKGLSRKTRSSIHRFCGMIGLKTFSVEDNPLDRKSTRLNSSH